MLENIKVMCYTITMLEYCESVQILGYLDYYCISKHIMEQCLKPAFYWWWLISDAVCLAEGMLVVATSLCVI